MSEIKSFIKENVRFDEITTFKGKMYFCFTVTKEFFTFVGRKYKNVKSGDLVIEFGKNGPENIAMTPISDAGEDYDWDFYTFDKEVVDAIMEDLAGKEGIYGYAG